MQVPKCLIKYIFISVSTRRTPSQSLCGSSQVLRRICDTYETQVPKVYRNEYLDSYALYQLDAGEAFERQRLTKYSIDRSHCLCVMWVLHVIHERLFLFITPFAEPSAGIRDVNLFTSRGIKSRYVNWECCLISSSSQIWNCLCFDVNSTYIHICIYDKIAVPQHSDRQAWEHD